MCILLHHNDPYLRLGPFKLEALNQNPEIAIIHEFVSSEDIKRIKDLARGRMKCTPYYSNDGTEYESSKARTSKIMYMNDYVVPEAMALSRKIEKATPTKKRQDRDSKGAPNAGPGPARTRKKDSKRG